MDASLAKRKSEEKYISVCFTILAQYLSAGEGEAPLPGRLVDMLSDSCVLPALASYLLNDSGELYAVVSLIMPSTRSV